MKNKSKRYRQLVESVDRDKVYTLEEAVSTIFSQPKAKFDESVDLNFNLDVDLKKSDQMIRGSARLPHGTGKKVKVLVFCEVDKEKEARDGGADYVGSKDLIDKVNGGWLDFDYCIATPSMMREVSKLGRVLGPRGLMPSPKVGTVTDNIKTAVVDAKKGKIDFKMDKFGAVNAAIGKVSFDSEKIIDNAKEFIKALLAAKPQAVKGRYIKSATISTTMGVGLKLVLNEDVEK